MKAEYTKENNDPFTVAEMTGLFRNHEIVTFTIPGVGETCAETALFRDALEELHRLAAKGLRAEQAEREIEAEIERLNSQLHEHYDYGTSRAVGAFRRARQELKGVEH